MGFKPPKNTKEDSLKALKEVKNVMEIHEKTKCPEPNVQAMVCMKNALACAEAFLHYHNIDKFSPKEVLEAFKIDN